MWPLLSPIFLIGIGSSGWEEGQPAQADLFDQSEQLEDNKRLLKTGVAETRNPVGINPPFWIIHYAHPAGRPRGIQCVTYFCPIPPGRQKVI